MIDLATLRPISERWHEGRRLIEWRKPNGGVNPLGFQAQQRRKEACHVRSQFYNNFSNLRSMRKTV